MTPLVLAVSGVLLVALSLYAIFGGADFGGGVWDVLAFGSRRERQRDAVKHAIGPVWETNHVWLIFVIVVLFTCFPAAFSDIAIGLYAPLTFALIGIVLRGAAFAFRSNLYDADRTSAAWGTVFGIASLMTPLAFGLAVGGLTAGDFSWTSPFSFVLGGMAIALCAQLAAVLLTVETTDAVRDDFRVRAIASTFVLAGFGALSLLAARRFEPATFASLTRASSLAAIAPAMLLGFAVLGLLASRRYAAARLATGAEVVAVLAGWYATAAPDVIPRRLSLAGAAAPSATLAAFLVLTAVGSVILVPSLLLLFRVFKTSETGTRTPVSGDAGVLRGRD